MKKSVSFKLSQAIGFKSKDLDLLINIQSTIFSPFTTSTVKDSFIPISYSKRPQVLSDECINHLDTRNESFPSLREEIVTQSNIFTLHYQDPLITDVVFTDVYGDVIPLYFYHSLETDDQINDIVIKDAFNNVVSKNLYRYIDETETIPLRKGIYHNLENTFSSVSYSYYIVEYTSIDGNGIQTSRRDIIDSDPVYLKNNTLSSSSRTYTINFKNNIYASRNYEVNTSFDLSNNPDKVTDTNFIPSFYIRQKSKQQTKIELQDLQKEWNLLIEDKEQEEFIDFNEPNIILRSENKYWKFALPRSVVFEHFATSAVTQDFDSSSGLSGSLVEGKYVLTFTSDTIPDGESILFEIGERGDAADVPIYSKTFTTGGFVSHEVDIKGFIFRPYFKFTLLSLIQYGSIVFSKLQTETDNIASYTDEIPESEIKDYMIVRDELLLKNSGGVPYSLTIDDEGGIFTEITTGTISDLHLLDDLNRKYKVIIEDGALTTEEVGSSTLPNEFLGEPNPSILVDLPEYELQTFNPAIPSQKAIEESLIQVSENVLFFSKGPINNNFTFDIIVKDLDGRPFRFLTTDTTKKSAYQDIHGIFYKVFPETDEILGASEASGFILLKNSISGNYTFYFSGFYNKETYSYPLNLNPVHNPKARTSSFYFYEKSSPTNTALDPLNAETWFTKSIEYLEVDAEDRILKGSEKYNFIDIKRSSSTFDKVTNFPIEMQVDGTVGIGEYTGSTPSFTRFEVASGALTFSPTFSVNPTLTEDERIFFPAKGLGKEKYTAIYGKCHDNGALNDDEIYDPNLPYYFDFSTNRFLEIYDSPGAGTVYKIISYDWKTNIITVDGDTSKLSTTNGFNSKYIIYYTLDAWRDIFSVNKNRSKTLYLNYDTVDSLAKDYYVSPRVDYLSEGEDVFLNSYPLVLQNSGIDFYVANTQVKFTNTFSSDFPTGLTGLDTGYLILIGDQASEIQPVVNIADDTVSDYIFTVSTGFSADLASSAIRAYYLPFYSKVTPVFKIDKDSTSENLYRVYTLEYNDTLGYYGSYALPPRIILAHTSVVNPLEISELEMVDARRRGGTIKDLDKAVEVQPDLYDCWDKGAWDNIPFPAACSIKIPVKADLLTEYGGKWTLDEIKERFNRYAALGSYPVFEIIDEHQPKVETIFVNTTTAVVRWSAARLAKIDIYLGTSPKELSLVETVFGDKDEDLILQYRFSSLSEGTVYYFKIIPSIIRDREYLARLPSRIYKMSTLHV